MAGLLTQYPAGERDRPGRGGQDTARRRGARAAHQGRFGVWVAELAAVNWTGLRPGHGGDRAGGAPDRGRADRGRPGRPPGAAAAAPGPGQLRARARCGRAVLRDKSCCPRTTSASWPPAGSRWACPRRHVTGCLRWRWPGPMDKASGLRAQAEAVTLFVERARQLNPDLALDGEAGAVVARLVQRLDGMPLAIELAAARVEALGLGQLLDRLDDRLLISANRAAPARQRSLDAAVDWSSQLLDRTRAARLPVPAGVPRAVQPGSRRSRGRDRRRSRGPAPGRLLPAGTARGRPGRAVPLLDAGDLARVRPAPTRTGGARNPRPPPR